MNHLLENCEFDFSKAKSTLKKAILAVSVVASLGMSADAEAFAYDTTRVDNSKVYEQVADNLSKMSDLGVAQMMANQYTVDKGGAEILNQMEADGKISTPLTFNDYSNILKTMESENTPVTLIKNPYSGDGIISMTTSKSTSMKFTSQVRDALGIPNISKLFADTASERGMAALDDYVSTDEKISDGYAESSKMIISQVSEYAGDDFKIGSKYKSSEHPYPDSGLKQSLNLGKEAPMNASKYSGSDYFIKTSSDDLISVGSFNLDRGGWDKTTETMFAYSTADNFYEGASKQMIEWGNEYYENSTLTDAEKIEVSEVAVSIHEIAHSFYDASMNREHNSMMLAAYETLAGFEKDRVTEIQDDWAISTENAPTHSRFSGEAIVDGVTAIVVGATASQEQWDYFKGANAQVRKADYLSALKSAAIGSEATGIPIEDHKMIFDVRSESDLKDGEVIFGIHEMAFAHPAMLKMMDEARAGNAPHLLELVEDPVKMVVASNILVAKSQAALHDITNNFEGVSFGDWDEFMKTGNDAAFAYAMSPEFVDLLNNLDTTPKNDLANKFDVKSESSEPIIAENNMNQDVKIQDVEAPVGEVGAFAASSQAMELAQMLAAQHKDCDHEHQVRDLRTERKATMGMKL